jgi:membrane protein implicated in regulation of membrane protease activity
MELANTEIWAIIGVVMMIIEIFAVSFFFLFVGIGALMTALLSWMGITDSLIAQLIVFSVISAASMFIFRKKLQQSLDDKGSDYNEFKGEKAKVISPISPNSDGKVFFRGADWIAYSDSSEEIPVNSPVSIKKADGIRLLVEKV